MNRTDVHGSDVAAVEDVPAQKGAVTIAHAQLRKKAQVTLPSEVRDALHIDEGDEVEFVVWPSGQVSLRGMTMVPADQRWFWTSKWQAGEREASEEIAAGDITTYDNVKDMFVGD